MKKIHYIIGSIAILLCIITIISQNKEIERLKEVQAPAAEIQKPYYYKEGDNINVYDRSENLITFEKSLEISNFWTKVEKYKYPQYSASEKELNYIYEKYLPVEQILAEVSMREYDKTKYNCIDMSEDMQRMLREQDIESSLMVGHTPMYHQWIAIWFDSMSGYFISPSEVYEFEQIVNSGHWDNIRQ